MATKKTATTTETKKKKIHENEGQAMSVLSIPVASIDVLEGFNVRSVSDAHPDGEGAREAFKMGSDKEPVIGVGSMGTSGTTLAKAIASQGLLQPILVRPHGDGRFAVVSGHRRFAAVQSLGWRTIPAVVRSMDEEEAYLLNLTENVQREDLSPGEVASRAILMRAKFATFADGKGGGSERLATALNISKPYMLNLLRLAEKLHPDIWNVCKGGRNPNAPPHNKLHKWVALEHDEQWTAYQEWRGVSVSPAAKEEEAAGEGGEGEGAVVNGDEGPTYKRPGKDALETMEIELVARRRANLINENEASVALAVLRYCIGKKRDDGTYPQAPYHAAKVKAPAATLPSDEPKKGAKLESIKGGKK